MSRFTVYTWTAADTTAVSALQTLAGAGAIKLNGTLAIGEVIGKTPVVIPFGNVSRTVSLTSANNLSAVNVTITGTYKGAVVTETRVGPNANTVYTAQLFDTVTAITTDAAVTALSAGSGTTGHTNWYLYNYQCVGSWLSAQVEISGTINYSFQTTLDNVETDNTPLVNTGIILPNSTTANVNTNTWITVMSSSTSSKFAWLSYPIRYANVLINSATDGTLILTLVQQGID